METNPTQNISSNDDDLRGIVDISPYPVIIHNNGLVKYVNNITRDFLALSTDESIAGKHIADFIHSDDIGKVSEAILLGNTIGKKDVIPEFRIIDKNKIEKRIQTKSTTVTFCGEKCRLVFIYNFNETTLVKTKLEEELLAYKYFQEKINKTSPVLISIFDIELGESIYRSFDAEPWLNYSPGTIPKKSIDLIRSEYKEEGKLIIEKMSKLKDGEVAISILPYLQGEGLDRQILSRYIVFERDKNGIAKSLLIAHSDVTDLREAQFQLDKTVKELSIKNEQLEKYITSNSELEKFAYIASHDLKEPIRSLIGFAQLLEKRNKDILSQESLEYIQNIIDGAQRMNLLVVGLLEYSRISSTGKAFAKVDTREIVKKMFTDLKTSLEENKVELLSYDLPEILCDELQIRQLFQNLISNSIKFKKEGVAPIIKIFAVKEGKNWLFKVEDNGIGIDMKFKDQIFQIFTRLNSYEKYQGSGIGLSLCKKVVERHGGQIWIESSPTIGTTVCFSIPE